MGTGIGEHRNNGSYGNLEVWLLAETDVCDEKTIITTIRERDVLVQDLREQMQRIQTDLKRTEEESAIYAGGTGCGPRVQGNSQRDIHGVWESFVQKKQEYERELCRMLEELQKAWERIDRIWLCYRSLPLLQFKVLCCLYEYNMKWSFAEKKSGLSHKRFPQVRREAITGIMHRYNSVLANEEIRNQQKNETGGSAQYDEKKGSTTNV